MSRRRSLTTFPTGQIKVVLFEGIHDSAKAFFESTEFIVVEVSGALPEDELIKHIADAHVVGIRSKTQITAKVLDNAPLLLCVGCFCIGTNQVDLGRANALGIPVFNAPFSNTRSVAELIISEIVMLARRLGDCVQELHQHNWNKSASGCHEVRGRTVGVVGYGHIGSQVGVLAEAFGMSVIFYDIAKRLPMGNNRSVASLDALLTSSDFVTFHVPATPDTSNMIQAEHIAKMQPGSYLLNASRGSVVNLDALANAVKSGHIAGAAIDVYPKEPRTNGPDFQSPLVGLPNVVLTPHIGGSTEEAQESIGEEVASSCASFVTQGNTATAVNFPHIEQKLRPNLHRVLNIHKNVPGIMSEVLQILSEHNANIHAQQLGTDDVIGYLVTDLDQSVSDDVKAAIAALPASIKTRILY
ncbi:MAG: phosphoglycerate dehydrogenase [Myxococcales bacterium]|nr:phosphoglycerate dehydrogenase [Myxococcales bacterium]